jgi:hypothetical protein
VRHADAAVRECDRVRLVVGGDGDGRGEVRLVDGLIGGLVEAQFLARVRRVRDQFADEDFLVLMRSIA